MAVHATPTFWTLLAASRDRGPAPDDVHHGILGEADVARDEAIGEPCLVQREDPLGLLIAAMIVRMSLPLAVLRSKLGPVWANKLTFHEWRSSSVWTRSCVLHARPHAAGLGDRQGLAIVAFGVFGAACRSDIPSEAEGMGLIAPIAASCPDLRPSS